MSNFTIGNGGFKAKNSEVTAALKLENDELKEQLEEMKQKLKGPREDGSKILII